MGNVPVTMAPEPPHKLLSISPEGYEIRAYPSYVAAETAVASTGSLVDNFQSLARYIGVFGSPGNNDPRSGKPQPLPMRMPIVVRETPRGPEVTPVPVRSEFSMQLILPDEYKSSSEAPQPMDPKIKIKDVKAKVVACVSYPGFSTPHTMHEVGQRLKDKVKKDGLPVHTPKGINEPICEFCGYDPPFKLVGRRNEVWLHLDMTEDEVLEAAGKCERPALPYGISI